MSDSPRFPFTSMLAIAAAVLFVVAACTRKTEQVFTVHGIVRAPYSQGAITIQHEEIPGFMPAMTMPFYADAGDVRDLAPGDRVEFEFRVGEQQSRAGKFRKIGTAPHPAPAAAAAGAKGDAIRRLRNGDPVPPFSLVDQHERPLSAADLRGHHTVVSFVFTRCPVPEFCPLIAKKLQAVQSQLRESPHHGRVQLLTITIDPEYDRPPVLREYGKALGADFDRWRFATGSVEEVEKLARLFAVRIERNAQALDHTLATALVGPDGNVVEIWRGNAWKPEEVVSRISG